MLPPRLVASDLDGTLLDEAGAATERTTRTWRRLWDRGIETVLVTARPPRWVGHLAPITGDHGVVICGNGAFVYDLAHGLMRESHGIAPDAVLDLVSDLRRELPGIVFSAELADGFHREEAYPATAPDGAPETAPPTVGPLEGLSGPVGKLLAVSDRVPDEEFLTTVREVVGERALLSTSCDGGLAEIGPRGVTKASALADWTEQLGIDAADVWAFGDMPNDIPMLSWAGTAWAVANAHPDVLAVADHVAPAHDEDGVARVLERWIEGS